MSVSSVHTLPRTYLDVVCVGLTFFSSLPTACAELIPATECHILYACISHRSHHCEVVHSVSLAQSSSRREGPHTLVWDTGNEAFFSNSGPCEPLFGVS